MTRLPVRLLVFVLALGTTGALGYHAFRLDLSIGGALDAARRSEQAVSSTRLTLSSLEATIRAMVAPGQSVSVWAAEAERQFDLVRDLLIGLDAGEPGGAETSLAGALDSVDRLAATVRRVRELMGGDQERVASGLVFRDARAMVADLDQQVERTGTRARTRHAASLAALRQEQALVAGGIVAVWLVAAVLLLPAARRPETSRAADDGHASTGDGASTDLRPAPAVELAARTFEPAAADGSPTVESLARTAEVCAELARLQEVDGLAPLVARAAEALEAKGLIVWIAGPTGMELFPAATHGYDPHVVARLGGIPRGAANLTAAAFRELAVQGSPGRDGSVAALAAPLVGPSGAVGVLSAELREGANLTPATRALAAIVAAQLASLLGAQPVVTDDTRPAQQANA
jgi:hypothetical protein